MVETKNIADKPKDEAAEETKQIPDEEKKEAGAEGEEEETFETNWDEVVTKFDQMGLKEEVLRGIYAYGFKEPSAI